MKFDDLRIEMLERISAHLRTAITRASELGPIHGRQVLIDRHELTPLLLVVDTELAEIRRREKAVFALALLIDEFVALKSRRDKPRSRRPAKKAQGPRRKG